MLLRDRADDVEVAVQEATEILRRSVARADTTPGWRVASLQATFGITLAAEAGLIVSRASAEASFEVVVTIERG